MSNPGESLRFSAQYGAPTVVRVEHNGRTYKLMLGTLVFDVSSTGLVGKDGLPIFNVKASPVLNAEEEDRSS